MEGCLASRQAARLEAAFHVNATREGEEGTSQADPAALWGS